MIADRDKEPKRHQRVAGNDQVDVHVVRNDRYMGGGPVSVMVHSREGHDMRVDFAMRCIEKWAMVAAESDGEDSSGRQRLRRMTPVEIVKHACDCAELAFEQIKSRGWTFEIPSYDVLVDKMKDAENGND